MMSYSMNSGIGIISRNVARVDATLLFDGHCGNVGNRLKGSDPAEDSSKIPGEVVGDAPQKPSEFSKWKLVKSAGV